MAKISGTIRKEEYKVIGMEYEQIKREDTFIVKENRELEKIT